RSEGTPRMGSSACALSAQGIPGARRAGPGPDAGRAAAVRIQAGRDGGRAWPVRGVDVTQIRPGSIYTRRNEEQAVSPTPSFTQPPPEPQRSGLLTALVAGALIALVAANIYLYIQVEHVRADMAKVQNSLTTELSNLRDASTVTSQSQQRHMENL